MNGWLSSLEFTLNILRLSALSCVCVLIRCTAQPLTVRSTAQLLTVLALSVLLATVCPACCFILLNNCYHVCREKDKKKKKGGDGDAESGGDSPGSPGDDAAADGEGDVVWMTDTSEQAAKDRAQAQLTKAMADMVTQVNITLCRLLRSHSTPTLLKSATRALLLLRLNVSDALMLAVHQ